MVHNVLKVRGRVGRVDNTANFAHRLAVLRSVDMMSRCLRQIRDGLSREWVGEESHFAAENARGG